MSKEKDKKQIKELFSPELEEEETETRESADLFTMPNSSEKKEAEDDSVERDLADDDPYDTQHTDGHTYNVGIAIDQGLTYTPPHDPPTQPSERDPQGAEVAAGFALSMEDSDPNVERLPDHIDNNDLDLLDDVYDALRLNSETAHLVNVEVQVDNGVVYLSGTVDTEDDLELVNTVVEDLEGVRAIRNNLQVSA
jgi:osmotically-inducible protein OsmY